jgi:AcrR family transcriptional regulator
MGRREEILDALIEILDSQGISANFRMKELAEKVNIGKSTLYEYFDTKDELLHQAVCRIVESGVQKIFSLEINSEDSFEDSFKRELHYIFNLALNSGLAFNLISPNMEQRMPKDSRKEVMDMIQDVKNHYNKRFEEVFKKGIVEGVLKVDSMITNRLMISSLVVGSIMMIANGENKLSELELKEYVNTLYVTVLRIAN